MKYGLVLLVLVAAPCWSQTTEKTQMPRRLSEAQKADLAACLKKQQGTFSIASIANNSEAYMYAQDWRDVFLSAGWEIEHKDIPIQIFRIGGGVWSGMRVAVHDASGFQGQTEAANGSPERNFAQCVNGRNRYSDRRTHYHL